MIYEINSGEIVSECLKEHGKGQLFFRADGLEFEETRVEARRQYLEAHPEIDAEYRDAIQKAAVTPGMMRSDVIAAWGLLQEDTRTVFGHVTSEDRVAYAYFTGLNVGECYAIYLNDDVVIGVRQTNELVPPHELEFTMRVAEDRDGLFYFYEGVDGQMRGSNVDQYFMDWDTQHLRLYTIELVVPWSIREVEGHLKSIRLIRQYELALLRLGYDSKTAPEELRTHIALSTLPYPGSRLPKDELQRAVSSPPHVSAAPIALPASSLELPDGPASVPLEKWFAYLAFGNPPEVAFPTVDGQVELVKVEWKRERLFRVGQVPLLVNAISLFDLVEAEWQDGDLIPRFTRVVETSALRTVRAIVTHAEREESIRHFAKLNTADRKRYRFEKGVLAFSISEPEFDEIAKEWLSYLPLTWIYTDTLTQE
jgi:hypothetical protein